MAEVQQYGQQVPQHVDDYSNYDEKRLPQPSNGKSYSIPAPINTSRRGSHSNGPQAEPSPHNPNHQYQAFIPPSPGFSRQQFSPRMSSIGAPAFMHRGSESLSSDRSQYPEPVSDDRPLASPIFRHEPMTHGPHPTLPPQAAVISSGDSQRSSASSGSFRERQNGSPGGRYSSRGGSPTQMQPQLQYHHQQRPLGPQDIRDMNNGAISRASSGNVSLDERANNTKHLAAPNPAYRRNSRPSSQYSSNSDLRAHHRAQSAHSHDSRHSSVSELPYSPQTPGNNDHLRGVIGANANLLDPKQTLELYRQTAKKSEPTAQLELALLMLQMAQKRQAIESPSASNPNLVGEATTSAATKAELLKEVRKILENIQGKLPHAQYILADALSNGIFNKGKGEPEKAFALFIAASKHGHSEAGYRTGLCYEYGWGCRQDPAKAETFYRQAASKNHPGAMTRLADACLNNDLGLTGRQREGVKWLKRATEVADAQHPSAPYKLGCLHESGELDDVFKDEAYAAQLFTQAAALGHCEANYKMGQAYEHGYLGCPKDPALSIHFYTGAAQQGHADAMMCLCAWYMVGAEPVLQQNHEEAYSWALNAAKLGMPGLPD